MVNFDRSKLVLAGIGVVAVIAIGMAIRKKRTKKYSADDNPKTFGKELAQELYPDGMPRGDVQGIIEAKFQDWELEEEALRAYDKEWDKLSTSKKYSADDNPKTFGKELAQELYPDGMPRGDVQGQDWELREEALKAYNKEWDKLSTSKKSYSASKGYHDDGVLHSLGREGDGYYGIVEDDNDFQEVGFDTMEEVNEYLKEKTLKPGFAQYLWISVEDGQTEFLEGNPTDLDADGSHYSAPIVVEYSAVSIDDYVEDIASRLMAHKLDDANKLWLDFPGDNNERKQLYNILSKRNVPYLNKLTIQAMNYTGENIYSADDTVVESEKYKNYRFEIVKTDNKYPYEVVLYDPDGKKTWNSLYKKTVSDAKKEIEMVKPELERQVIKKATTISDMVDYAKKHNATFKVIDADDWRDYAELKYEGYKITLDQNEAMDPNFKLMIRRLDDIVDVVEKIYEGREYAGDVFYSTISGHIDSKFGKSKAKSLAFSVACDMLKAKGLKIHS